MTEPISTQHIMIVSKYECTKYIHLDKDYGVYIKTVKDAKEFHEHVLKTGKEESTIEKAREELQELQEYEDDAAIVLFLEKPQEN